MREALERAIAPPARQRAVPFVCPRCGQHVSPARWWEAMPAPEDRQPAYRLRHQRADGSWCIVYAGPPVEGPTVTP